MLKSGSLHPKPWSCLEKDRVLYGCIHNPDCEELLQLLLPETLRPEVLQALHKQHDHQGFHRIVDLVRRRRYWPGMTWDIQQWCQVCKRCTIAKDSGTQAAPQSDTSWL